MTRHLHQAADALEARLRHQIRDLRDRLTKAEAAVRTVKASTARYAELPRDARQLLDAYGDELADLWDATESPSRPRDFDQSPTTGETPPPHASTEAPRYGYRCGLWGLREGLYRMDRAMNRDADQAWPDPGWPPPPPCRLCGAGNHRRADCPHRDPDPEDEGD